MKEELCKAFCQDLEVVKVPAGLAIGTGFQKSDGDRIGFYIVGPDAAGHYRVQDDGATVPWLEACGVDLDLESGAPELRQMLAEYGVSLDAETFEITSEPMARSAVPKAGLRLVAALLRLQDSDLMTHEPAGSSSGAHSKWGLDKAG